MTRFCLSQVADIDSGVGFPLQYQGTQNAQFPFLKVSDMNLHGNERSICTWNHSITDEVRIQLRAKAFPAGALIFPKVGGAIGTNKKRQLTRPSCVDNNVMAVSPKQNKLDADFLYFLFQTKNLSEFASASNPPSIRKSDVEAWSFDLPPLPEQLRLVDILSRAEGIVRLRREAERKAAELIPALFIDLFGDPATNPKGWPAVTLGEIASVQGGLQLTKTRASLPLERPYLRVANVHRSRLELGEIKLIRLSQTELERTRLLPRDLLLVEGHGNPQEIGRVAMWDDSIPDCVHQNHLIRARLNNERANPVYICEFLNSQSGRQFLLRSGKTTSGLSTISVSNVRAATILLPEVTRQNAFAEQVAAIRAIQSQQAAATAKAQASFDALLAEAFGG